MIDREAVRANAKYLRQVRPIDPEEICEYIEGQPHPGVVRQTLREEAFDLALRERADGTFVPVDDDPVPPPGWEPTAFPEPYARALEDRLVGELGADWHAGATGEQLREAIRRLKADYFHNNPVEYDETAALGYAIYHLPDYYAAVGYVLDALAERRLLGRRLRVLDVGAGTGGPALGLHDYLPDDALVDYHALEPSPAAAVLERLLDETGRNFRATVHRERAKAFDPADLGGSVDLLCFCNVLSELADPVAIVERYLPTLAADGTLLLLSPADLETATGLRTVERALAGSGGDRGSGEAGGSSGAGDVDRGDGGGAGLTVYAPTLRLWPDASPADRGWSFDVRPDVEPPGFQRRLDEAGGDEPGTFLKTSVQFAYALLRRDGERRFDVRASPERHAKMAEMGRHVSKRVDLLAVKLSHDLSDDGNPLFKVGDGSEQVEHYAVLTRESALNRDLVAAPYGAVLAFENLLVLWNEDEDAYNLVVDDETVVDVVAG